jgi:DNA-binding transcriptional regulator YdaS (Cro superfamily)
MTRSAFAAAIGVSNSFVSQLCADNGPWPRREIARRIGEVTKGEVTPNDLAGYQRRRK